MSPTIGALVVLVFIVVGLVSWWFADRIDVPNGVIIYGSPIAGLAVIYWYGTLLAWLFGICLILLGIFVFYLRLSNRPEPDKHDPPV